MKLAACGAIAVVCAAWALVRTLGLEAGFPLLPLMAYTPYVALLALVGTGACVLLRQWPATVAAGLAALLLVIAVAPRALGGPDEEAEGRSLRVMSANVFRGQGDPETLVRLVREQGVELLAVQEMTPDEKAALREAGIDELLPHAVLSLNEEVRGSGLYSRYPLERRSIEGLEFKQTRGLLELPDGSALDVVSVHPKPPATRGWIPEWKAGFDALPEAGEAAEPSLLLGDFNSTLDFDRLRELIATGYADAADRVGEGLSSTWPADRSWLPGVTIDHVLLPEAWAVRDYEVLELPGSDHRPIYAELVIPPARDSRSLSWVRKARTRSKGRS